MERINEHILYEAAHYARRHDEPLRMCESTWRLLISAYGARNSALVTGWQTRDGDDLNAYRWGRIHGVSIEVDPRLTHGQVAALTPYGQALLDGLPMQRIGMLLDHPRDDE